MMVVNQTPKVLVVDDNPVVRDMLADVVTMLGYSPDPAANGPEALALFEQNHYDIVLTDILMPGMTGFEVLEALRLRDPKIPVVVITGSPVNLDDPRVAQPGVALVRKPLAVTVLGQVINRLLENRLGS